MSKRFSLAKVQAAENFNRWNKFDELGSDHGERIVIKDKCQK